VIPEEIDRILSSGLASPLSEEEMEDLRERLRVQERYTELLRRLPLDREEPFWPPAHEETS